MAILSKAALLAATGLPRETVPTPEIQSGSSVIVQGLSANEREEVLKATTKGRGMKARTDMAVLRLIMVARCTVDEDGKRLFSDADFDQIAELRSDIVERIFVTAARLSGMNGGDPAEDVDEDDDPAKKKWGPGSGSVQNGSSISTSPES